MMLARTRGNAAALLAVGALLLAGGCQSARKAPPPAQVAPASNRLDRAKVMAVLSQLGRETCQARFGAERCQAAEKQLRARARARLQAGRQPMSTAAGR